MIYDESTCNDPVLCRSYQSALSCFTSGTDVYSTYALAFYAMVQAVPINPENSLVDYTCANPAHYEARYVRNRDHAWSAIRFGENDPWHFYEITFYDIGEAPARTEYLNISASVLVNGYHNSPHAFK